MKKQLFHYTILVSSISVFILACVKNKQVEEEVSQIVVDSVLQTQVVAPVPVPASIHCTDGPEYKDSLIYRDSKSPENYIVKPVNNPGSGKYYSWPQGMVLDSITGSINVSKSETGLKYKIGFVKTGTKDTCVQIITLSGVSYLDSIYVLSKNQTLAHPYFDGNLQTASICIPNADDDDDDDDDGNDKCEFKSNMKKVKVRTITGIIDLKKTLENKAFGNNPVNGQFIKAAIYYKLNDKSKKASQKVDVQLVYYNTKSDIPKDLVEYVQQKRSDVMMKSIISSKGNPRPPLIIITRS